MGICCQTAQEGPTLDPLEEPEIREIERQDSTSSISSRINSEDIYGNCPQEELDDQMY